MESEKYSFKYVERSSQFFDLDINLQIIFLKIADFCHRMGFPAPIITSMIRGRLKRSISDAHGEGRAIDLRSWIYTEDQIELILEFANDMFAAEFGTAPQGKEPKVLIYEKIGENSHLHSQVRRC